jgi:hypothetical protein
MKTLDLEQLTLDNDGRRSHGISRLKSAVPVSDQRPPWKGSDPTPKDTWRNNYLENGVDDADDDVNNKLNRLKKLEATAARHRIARSRLKGVVGMQCRSSSLTRSKSTTAFGNNTENFLHASPEDPSVWTVVGGAPFIASHSYIGVATSTGNKYATNQQPQEKFLCDD